jgi:hypothetical protein
MSQSVKTLAEFDPSSDLIESLLERFGLSLTRLDSGRAIPGSYWGDTEAGLIEDTLFATPETPLHSLLHEACHWICMDPARRGHLHTDAGGDDAEENAVCYLQVLLADAVPGVGRERLLADMDAWGYSFRLGSAKDWFEQDAQDAERWLLRHGLINAHRRPTWRVRQDGAAPYT